MGPWIPCYLVPGQTNNDEWGRELVSPLRVAEVSARQTAMTGSVKV